jgi:hypothetical protein
MEHLVDAARDIPVAVKGPRLASDVVLMAREGAGVLLDYSPPSLALLDRLIDTVRGGRPPHEAVVPALFGFGAYVGEVLVRGTGAQWTEFDADQRRAFGQPFGIRTPDGRTWNPLGEAVKRYRNGPRDGLWRFYLSVDGRLPPAR